jgi:uncharacterized protein (TIGR02145 family)
LGGFFISLPIAGVTTLVGALIGKAKIKVPVNGSFTQYRESKEKLALYTINASPLFTDIDGNEYHKVIINGRVWMSENLRVKRYRNGDSIPEIRDDDAWSKHLAGASCSIENDPRNDKEFGRLYNRYAVNDSRSLCPSGWHIPSFEEWNQLFTSVAGEEDAGEWIRQNLQGRTFTSMTGYRNNSGIFKERQESNYFWWPKSGPDETIIGFSVSRKSSGISYINKFAGENAGMSVRCVKDY